MLSSDFIFGTLLLHKSPVVQSFHLTRYSECSFLQIELWVRFAVDRFVRDLKIDFECVRDHCLIRFPSRLFRCETFESLELNYVIVLEVPFRVCFQSLKTLRLIYLKYTYEESFIRLVSSSPVLENLVVKNSSKDNGQTFTINVPSLRSLSVIDVFKDEPNDDDLFVIHSHSLSQLVIIEEYGEVNFIGDMPQLVEASLETFDSEGNALESLTFVKRLSLSFDYVAQCILFVPFSFSLCVWSSAILVRTGRICLCACSNIPLYYIFSSLKTNIRLAGQLTRVAGFRRVVLLNVCCTISKPLSVQSMKVTPPIHKEVAIYILKIARRLVTATVSEHVFEELESATRCSRACELTMG